MINPNECVRFFRKSKGIMTILHVDALPEVQRGTESLYSIFSKYARFDVNIVTHAKESGKNGIEKETSEGVKASIPFFKLRGMEERTRNILSLKQDNDGQQETQQNSLPFSVKFGMGKLKGKTPGEVAMEPDGRNALLSQREFLFKNIQKYPANQNLIAAIDAAVAGLDSGTLRMETVEKDIYVLKTDVIMPGAARSENVTKAYAISICYAANADAFDVEIMNCMTPFEKSPEGLFMARLKDAKDVHRKTFRLSEEEWLEMLDKMLQIKATYASLKFAEIEREVSKLAFDYGGKRAKAKKEASDFFEDIPFGEIPLVYDPLTKIVYMKQKTSGGNSIVVPYYNPNGNMVRYEDGKLKSV